jgi:hypothetical protein
MDEQFFQYAAWGDNIKLAFRLKYNIFLFFTTAIVPKCERPKFVPDLGKIPKNYFKQTLLAIPKHYGL